MQTPVIMDGRALCIQRQIHVVETWLGLAVLNINGTGYRQYGMALLVSGTEEKWVLGASIARGQYPAPDRGALRSR